MSKYLIETYYTCNIKVSHYLDNISENNLQNLEKREDGKFEILDMKLDSRKTKNLDKIDDKKIDIIDKEEGIFKNLDVEENLVNDMIMQAREKWFVEEK